MIVQRPHVNQALASHICPMHFEVRQNELGECPICGSVLVPEQWTDSRTINPALYHPANPSKHKEERLIDGVTQDNTSEVETRRGTRRHKWLSLIVALGIGAGILGWEYKEVLFMGTGSLALLLLLCVGVHFFMHRGHGGGGNGS